VCDHDVDARVAARLRKLGHDAWTAAEAGLNRALDDDLTVYADNQRAVLVSHDSEFPIDVGAMWLGNISFCTATSGTQPTSLSSISISYSQCWSTTRTYTYESPQTPSQNCLFSGSKGR
jgi:hypothetical protein